MADSGLLSARRTDSLSGSSVSMETITSLTELEDLERVYQQLCAEEVSEQEEVLLVEPALLVWVYLLVMIDSTGRNMRDTRDMRDMRDMIDMRDMRDMRQQHHICSVHMRVMSGLRHLYKQQHDSSVADAEVGD